MYQIHYDSQFVKDLKKIDIHWAKTILDRLESHDFLSDPKAKCKSLTANLKGYWRLRVGDYRILLDINDGELKVIALHTAHRRNVYK